VLVPERPLLNAERRKLSLTELPSLIAERDRRDREDQGDRQRRERPRRARGRRDRSGGDEAPRGAPDTVALDADARRAATTDRAGYADLVAEILDPVLDQFVDSIVRTVEDLRPPDAAPLDGAFEHNLLTAVEAALRQFTALMDGADASTLDLEVFRELGRKHALVGYPLEDLLWLYRVGTMACWHQATALYREGRFDDEVLVAVGEAVFSLSHTLAEAATAGYTSETASASTLAQARRFEFLRRLLTGIDLAPGELEVASREFGWDLPERVVVAVASVDPEASFPARSFGSAALVEGAVGEHHVALLPSAGTEPPEVRPPSGVTHVALGPAVDPASARRSYDGAVRLLELADRGVVPRDPVVSAADQWLALLLDCNPHLAADLVDRRLREVVALAERRREPLLETLMVWLTRPGQISAIAEELHVHSQTVRYRIDRLRELVGPSLDDPDARLELLLAAQALRHRLHTGEA
jgi:hypothetical protein